MVLSSVMMMVERPTKIAAHTGFGACLGVRVEVVLVDTGVLKSYTVLQTFL